GWTGGRFRCPTGTVLVMDPSRCGGYSEKQVFQRLLLMYDLADIGLCILCGEEYFKFIINN
ncbi:MAG: hypothetical protein PHH05_03015, partial [Syntrophaceticus sp.]|nr:hypothetical protein [Syntrophaceticus sp.]